MLRPSPYSAGLVDSYINKLCKYIVGLHPDGGETVEEFCIRRSSAVKQKRQDVHFDIRKRWALKLTTWMEHVYRHPDDPAYALIQCQNDEWLREERREATTLHSARDEDAGLTRTRAGPGAPIRWGHQWVECVFISAMGWNNESRSKAASRERAEIVQIFLS